MLHKDVVTALRKVRFPRFEQHIGGDFMKEGIQMSKIDESRLSIDSGDCQWNLLQGPITYTEIWRRWIIWSTEWVGSK